MPPSVPLMAASKTGNRCLPYAICRENIPPDTKSPVPLCTEPGFFHSAETPGHCRTIVYLIFRQIRNDNICVFYPPQSAEYGHRAAPRRRSSHCRTVDLPAVFVFFAKRMETIMWDGPIHRNMRPGLYWAKHSITLSELIFSPVNSKL